MKKADPLPALLRAFFYEWLVEQRNASVHTVRSYRDTWRLFLRFVAQRHHRTVAQLRFGDLTGSEVGAFLQYTEQERGDSIGTRNCRLAALRSFFGFVAGREPATAEQCAEVLRIPTKRAPLHAPSYLDPRRWKPFWHNPIVQRPKVNAITRCCPSCTTQAPASRKRSIYARTQLDGSLPPVCVSMARVARNVSVRCGRKPCRCSKHC